jgi:hypothetical protein
MADVTRTRISPKTYNELFLSPEDHALPDVSDYFGNSAGKFIEFINLVRVPINARLYSNRTGSWLKSQSGGRVIGMEVCVPAPREPGAPLKFGSKKSIKKSKKSKKSIKKSKKSIKKSKKSNKKK